MALITLPSWYRVATVMPMLMTSQRLHASPFGGSEQVQDLLNDRWKFDVSLPARKHIPAAALEAWVHSFRGMVNWVNLHHAARPAPLGTARGTMTLNASVAQGASAITITGISPATGTLLPGDMLGVGGLLLQVQDAATAVAGVATVNIVNRLRTSLSNGAAVTWDKPTAAFRLHDHSGVQYMPGMVESISLTFVEKI